MVALAAEGRHWGMGRGGGGMWRWGSGVLRGRGLGSAGGGGELAGGAAHVGALCRPCGFCDRAAITYRRPIGCEHQWRKTPRPSRR